MLNVSNSFINIFSHFRYSWVMGCRWKELGYVYFHREFIVMQIMGECICNYCIIRSVATIYRHWNPALNGFESNEVSSKVDHVLQLWSYLDGPDASVFSPSTPVATGTIQFTKSNCWRTTHRGFSRITAV